ncbi:MAG: 3',5'-cyclic-AMP phosphodiesterase [Methylococcaceae bacterium]
MAQHFACLSLLQITDLHILATPQEMLLGINTEHYFRAVLDMAFAKKQHYDLILLTGDLAQDPCKASYQRIAGYLKPYNTPCVCLPGNHDNYSLMQQILNNDQINCRKQIILNNWQIINLNSQIVGAPNGRLAKQELALVKQCLTSQPHLNTLIAVHHNCLPTQSAWMDTMTIQNSGAFLDLVSQYPQVKVISTGHIHQAMDTYYGDIRVLGTPSTCFQFTPKSKGFSVDNTAPGYRTLQLYADGHIETEVFRLPDKLHELQAHIGGY